MSNLTKLENLKQIVEKEKVNFEELAKIHSAVNFKREAGFAMQILSNPKNDYLASIAFNNPDSLKFAILNVAAIGLSISPVHKLAYLLPRKKEVCLDISYRGLIQLAINIGSIKWAQVFIVCEKDKFQLKGLDKPPKHEFDPMLKEEQRGKIKGVYCCVKTHDGDYLTHTMTVEDILAIRARSESWIAFEKDNSKSTPWVTDEIAMFKKTCVRGAHVWWPMTDTARKRFEEAIDVTNTAEPLLIADTVKEEDVNTSEEVQEIKDILTSLNKSEAEFLAHQTTVTKREIKKLEDLTPIELKDAQAFLNQCIEKLKTKTEKKINENNESNRTTA
jgi:recombination protein RecT